MGRPPGGRRGQARVGGSGSGRLGRTSCGDGGVARSPDGRPAARAVAPWPDDRPGRALRPDRRGLRALVGAGPRPGRRWSCSTDSGRRLAGGAPLLDVGTGHRHSSALGAVERWPDVSVVGDRRLGRDGRRGRGGGAIGASTGGARPLRGRRSRPPTTCRSRTATFDAALSSFVLPARPEPARAPCARSAASCARARRSPTSSWLDATIGAFAPDDDLRRRARRVRLRPARRGRRPDAGRHPVGRARGRRAAPGRASRTVDRPTRRRSTHRFTVDGYIGFLTEFDEEIAVRRARARPARAASLATLRERLTALDARSR